MVAPPTFMPWEQVDVRPSATDMNAQLYTPLAFLLNPPKVRVVQTTPQTMTDDDEDPLVWDLAESDNYRFWDPAHPTRITPTVSGWYKVQMALAWPNSSTDGIRSAWLWKNGTADQPGRDTKTLLNGQYEAGMFCVVFANGTTDYFEMTGFQSTGGDIDTVGSDTECYFRWFRR